MVNRRARPRQPDMRLSRLKRDMLFERRRRRFGRQNALRPRPAAEKPLGGLGNRVVVDLPRHAQQGTVWRIACLIRADDIVKRDRRQPFGIPVRGASPRGGKEVLSEAEQKEPGRFVFESGEFLRQDLTRRFELLFRKPRAEKNIRRKREGIVQPVGKHRRSERRVRLINRFGSVNPEILKRVDELLIVILSRSADDHLDDHPSQPLAVRGVVNRAERNAQDIGRRLAFGNRLGQKDKAVVKNTRFLLFCHTGGV